MRRTPSAASIRKRYEIKPVGAGIYHVVGLPCPAQIIVSSELSDEDNLWIYGLRSGLTTDDALRLDEVVDVKNEKVQAYMYAVLFANRKTFKEVKKMNWLDKMLKESAVDAEIRKARQDVLRALEIRFKTVPKDVQKSVEAYTDSVALDSLHETAIVCESVKEFRQALVH